MYKKPRGHQFIIYHKWNFKEHHKLKIAKCKQVISMIWRSFRTIKFFAMLRLWKSPVLQIIEHCSATVSGRDSRKRFIVKDIHRKNIGNARFRLLRETSKDFIRWREGERYDIIYIWRMLEDIVSRPNEKIISYMRKRDDSRFCHIPPIERKRTAERKIKTLSK